MVKIAIIGHTGFVGQYIHRIFPEAHCFNSKNVDELKNQTFDLVFCSGINATKWIANKNPEEDWANISKLIQVLKTITIINKFILISTIDIYDISNTLCVQNEIIISSQLKEAYGKHRYQIELQLKEYFTKQLLIIRLGALFGFGLKKNILFDIIQKSKITYNPKSCFQWYNMQWFKQDLKYILNQHQIDSINLFCEPLSNEELMSNLKEITNIEETISTNSPQIYNIQTIHNNNTSYWRCKNASLQSIKRFMTKMCHDNGLIISSLTNINFKNAFPIYNIQNLEIAPFSFFGDGFINRELTEFEIYKNQNIYSFQGLFYPYNWKLDIDYDLILEYLLKLIDIAKYLNTVKILVFGSPKLRSVPNAKILMTKLLTAANKHINNYDLYICMEPNATFYNCDFLTNASDTAAFILELNLSNIKMMLDTGNMYLEHDHEDLLFKYAPMLKHIHFSAPKLIALCNFKEGALNYNLLIKKLQKLNYKGKFTMECLNISMKELLDSLFLILADTDFTVIGGGWFGCHITKQLMDNGYNVKLIEKEKELFNGVSSHNQNRLHLGFHYPRSFNTRLLCQSNYEKFLFCYGSFVSFIEDNCYYISKDSCIDFETYKQIISAQGLPFIEVEIDHFKLLNLNQKCLQVKEGIIDFHKAKDFFKNTLHRNVKYEKEINASMKKKNWILDCTYNELQRVPNTTFEPSVSLIYQTKTIAIKKAITVMDGPFWSLYPYNLEENLYTLTHVGKGRIENFSIEDIEQDILKYYPEFLNDFVYKDFFIVKKCLMNSTCASRELQTFSKGNITSAVCGKITGIFDFEKDIFDLLL